MYTSNNMADEIFSAGQRAPMDRRLIQKLAQPTGGKDITVTHITIRQSISLLLLKLVLIEAIAAGALIAFHAILFTTNVESQLPEGVSLFNIPVFLTLVAIKTFVTFFVIFQWLEECYEITPKEIIHKRGFFFKHEDRHSLNHLVSLKVYQGIFGKLFNYGTLTMFNWAKNKEVSLYLIHNPKKYLHILEHLLPEPDEERNTIRERLIEEDE